MMVITKKQCMSLILRQRQLPDTPPYSASDSCSPPEVKGECHLPSSHVSLYFSFLGWTPCSE